MAVIEHPIGRPAYSVEIRYIGRCGVTELVEFRRKGKPKFPFSITEVRSKKSIAALLFQLLQEAPPIDAQTVKMDQDTQVIKAACIAQ